MGELFARVRANLRRPRVAEGSEEAVFRFGTVEIDRTARLVRRGGAEVHLTPIEYRLLSVLASNADGLRTLYRLGQWTEVGARLRDALTRMQDDCVLASPAPAPLETYPA